MIIPHPKYCQWIRDLLVELEGPIPKWGALDAFLSPDYPYTFVFDPKSSLIESVEVTRTLPARLMIKKRLAWRRHFPTLRTFELRVHITQTPPPQGLYRHPPPYDSPRYFCESRYVASAVKALGYGIPQIKAEEQMTLQVRCEGCRREGWVSAAEYEKRSRAKCGCEEQIAAALKSLFVDTDWHHNLSSDPPLEMRKLEETGGYFDERSVRGFHGGMTWVPRSVSERMRRDKVAK